MLVVTPLVCVTWAVLVGPEKVMCDGLAKEMAGLGPPFPRSDRRCLSPRERRLVLCKSETLDWSRGECSRPDRVVFSIWKTVVAWARGYAAGGAMRLGERTRTQLPSRLSVCACVLLRGVVSGSSRSGLSP